MTIKNERKTSRLSNKKLILATVSGVMVLLTSAYFGASLIHSEAVTGKWPPPSGQPSTGVPHLVAMKITPQPDDKVHQFTEVRIPIDAPWLEKVITNAGQKSKITKQELEQFYAATADGNTDFKIIHANGAIEYYRIYFVEVP